MNEDQSSFQPNWIEVLSKVSVDDADVSSILQTAFEMFKLCPNDHRYLWLKTALQSWNEFSDENILHQFFSIFLNISWQFLISDLTNLNTFIEVIEQCIESPHRIIFLTIYGSLLPSFFPDCNAIDLNFFLAIQSPIFSYSVNRNPDSEVVCQNWFHTLASTQGREIFKDNYQLALSYFKIMNHAFFQISITTASELQQEEIFVNAQKAMKAAIVAITNIISQ